MSYLEELLPEFRKGAKIRLSIWRKDKFIIRRGGDIVTNDNYDYPLSMRETLSNQWELYKDPEPDWQYIIDHNCLCWFWDNCDKEGWRRARCLRAFIPNGTNPFLDEAGYFWPYCRPVRKDEVTFYEDKEK